MSILSVIFSYVCLIYAEIFKKTSNGGLEVSFSILSFHYFIALHLTLSRLHHRLPKSFKADAISSLHLLKSIREVNLYFGPFKTILRILESGIIFRFPVIP